MAKLKKRSKVQQRNRVTARDNARKATKSSRGKASKRTVARAKFKRIGVNKAARKKGQRMKQLGAPTVETVVVDVIEKPAPDVITITEFEETEVREGIPGRDEPDFTRQR
jgi:hypothetical protein